MFEDRYKTILTDDPTLCVICMKRACQWHHVFHGNSWNKKLSEKLGLMAPLCDRCHTTVHHEDGEWDIKLKAMAQRCYLIKIFGRCYI